MDMNYTRNLSLGVRAVDPVLQITLYSVVGTVSLSTNIIFIYVICCTNKMKAHQTSLLANLAVSDICIIIVGIPLTLANLLFYEPITKGVLCQAQGFLLLLLFLHSNFNLTYIALQRYLIICKSRFYSSEMTKRGTVFQIMTTWVCAFIVSIPSLLGWGKLDYNYGRAHCMLVWGHSITYLLFVQFTAFTIPLIIIIFSYYNVIAYSKRTCGRLKGKTDEMKVSRKLGEYRLTLALIIVIITFFVLFMPYAVMLYYEGFTAQIASEKVSFAAMLMAYCSSMTDFWIYSYMNVKCCTVVIDAISRKIFSNVRSTGSVLSSDDIINSGDFSTLRVI